MEKEEGLVAQFVWMTNPKTLFLLVTIIKKLRKVLSHQCLQNYKVVHNYGRYK